MARPSIVVVPLSTLPNWEREFALWAPQMNVIAFMGNQAARDVIKAHEFYVPKDDTSAASKAKGLQVVFDPI